MSRKKRTARNHRTAARPGGASPRPWRLSKRLTLLGGVVAGVLLLLGVALLMRPERRSDVATPPAPPPRAYQTSAGDAIFVGRAVCSTCHAEQDQRWHGSHHDLAMQVADEQTVLGDFENATFTYRDVTTTFFRRDGKFFVRTDGPDGQLHDYEVAYTFGVTPLQQYLIAFPGGRYQALGIAWDSRPQDAGGQHWFHLYPEQRLAPGNPLHWTGLDQTWNYQCAECHSTNLQKNYRLDGDRYETTWSELNVACEACHGPGSRHVAWAKAGGTVPTPEEPSKGLMVQLTGRDDAAWVMDPHTGSAKRTTPLPARFEVETCARCHARRGILDDRYVPGRSLMDTHRPALLEEGLYYADGQIQDEVYEYGSFLQSKMYRAGVTCSDCHDPHSLRLRDTENALCAHCHSPERFDTSAHHFHQAGSAGSQCVACHMPTKTYMGVDARRDHSLRRPRPDLSVQLGTPNACTACHTDRPPQWAADTIVRWYGPGPRPPHFATALHAGRTRKPGAEGSLVRLLGDAAMPGMARATAVSLLGRYLSPQSLRAVESALADGDPLVRMAAVAVLEPVEPHTRLRLAAPLLRDAIRAVRIEAARILAPLDTTRLSAEQRAALELALAEYRQAQERNADRPEAHLNLGVLQAQLGKPLEAERAYRTALRIDPSFAPTYVNLADLYRAQNRDEEGENILRQGLAVSPDDAALHHALGLLLVRRGRQSEALGALGRAAALRPDNPHYNYVFGVALHSVRQSTRALEVLTQAHARHPGEPEILIGLATISRERGQLDSAIGYARKLVELVPYDQGARQLLAELEAQRR
jgi:Flp pilus assembly protein TadD